ncbi:MAG: MFS transporter, partial [Candidatus Methanomethylicus sp.]|nr:MFS transporter [Candidatus Methanomethylicus sp.]
PDTREILKNLKGYYPESMPQFPVKGVGPFESPKTQGVSISILGTFVASAFSWGGMVMGMSIVSIILQQYGVALTMINIAVSLHVFGMFGLSIPFGWLTDRFGRRIVMALGGAILGLGAFIMPITSNYLIITLGVFLIGLGWSATNVASTALLCDLTPGPRRGSILGANDVATGATSVALPTLGGAILSSLGFFAFAIAGVLVSLPVILSVIPVHEPLRGKQSCP